MASFDIDIDPDEIVQNLTSDEKEDILYQLLRELSKDEKREILEEFSDDISTSTELTIRGIEVKTSKHDTLYDDCFLESLIKIFNSRSTLSFDQQEYFIKFSRQL